jgi:hypothetical protein
MQLVEGLEALMAYQEPALWMVLMERLAVVGAVKFQEVLTTDLAAREMLAIMAGQVMVLDTLSKQ